MLTTGTYLWKIEKIVSKGTYNYAVVRNHPKADKHGYVLEHRVVVENHLNRLLNSDEIVHHKNGQKKDNRITNLEVLTTLAHNREHSKDVGKRWVTLRCPNCSALFDKPRNQTFLDKGGESTCCSRRCRGQFSARIQYQGRTQIVEDAISGNLVREYRKYYRDNPEETA